MSKNLIMADCSNGFVGTGGLCRHPVPVLGVKIWFGSWGRDDSFSTRWQLMLVSHLTLLDAWAVHPGSSAEVRLWSDKAKEQHPELENP